MSGLTREIQSEDHAPVPYHGTATLDMQARLISYRVRTHHPQLQEVSGELGSGSLDLGAALPSVHLAIGRKIAAWLADSGS